MRKAVNSFSLPDHLPLSHYASVSGGLRIKIPVHFEADILVIDWEPFAVPCWVLFTVYSLYRAEYNGAELTGRFSNYIYIHIHIYTYSVLKTLTKVHCCLCVWYGVSSPSIFDLVGTRDKDTVMINAPLLDDLNRFILAISSLRYMFQAYRKYRLI